MPHLRTEKWHLHARDRVLPLHQDAPNNQQPRDVGNGYSGYVQLRRAQWQAGEVQSYTV